MKTLTRFCRRGAIAAMCLLGLLAMPQVSAQQPFVVEGELTGVPDGTVLMLMERRGEMSVQVDADTLHGGCFSLKALAPNTQLYHIRTEKETYMPNMHAIWVQNGDKVTVKGNNRHGFSWQVESTNPMQAEQEAYCHVAEADYWEVSKQDAYADELRARIEKAPEEQKQMLTDSLRAVNACIDSLDAAIAMKQFNELKQRYVRNGKVDKLSPCAELLFTFIAVNARYNEHFPSANEIRAFYKMIPEDGRQSHDMQQVVVLLFPPEVVKQGDRMYNEAVLYDLQGGQHRLSDYNKGKYLLLDFWSSGCGPCIAAFPELKEVSEELKDSLVVISLSADSDKQWKIASEQHHITWENLNDLKGRTDIFAHYGINATPFYVIISPEGKIVKTFTGYSKGRIKQKLSGIFPQYKKKD